VPWIRGLNRKKKMEKGKIVKDRETFRLAVDVRKMFQAALDATGSDKSDIFNEAIRQACPAVVDAILRQQREREQRAVNTVKQIQGRRGKNGGKGQQ
jgi:hypothetical protein